MMNNSIQEKIIAEVYGYLIFNRYLPPSAKENNRDYSSKLYKKLYRLRYKYKKGQLSHQLAVFRWLTAELYLDINITIANGYFHSQQYWFLK